MGSSSSKNDIMAATKTSQESVAEFIVDKNQEKEQKKDKSWPGIMAVKRHINAQ